jgi:hypothetical protein
MEETDTAQSEADADRQAALRLNRKRWAGVSPEERREHARQMMAKRTPAQMGGRPRTKGPRCPCGAMTLKRARARAHKCVKVAKSAQ